MQIHGSKRLVSMQYTKKNVELRKRLLNKNTRDLKEIQFNFCLSKSLIELRIFFQFDVFTNAPCFVFCAEILLFFVYL